MVMEIPTGLPPEVVPISWLLGKWEGAGVITHHGEAEDEFTEEPFIQEVEFKHGELPYLEYVSHTWLVDDEGKKGAPLNVESGIWQLSREFTEKDAGPGMFPGDEGHTYADAEQVEKLRNKDNGFDLLVSIVHPGGINELYLGDVKNARIRLRTDAVTRAQGAKTYAAATRMYGWVNGELLWAWDVAANGKSLESHASAQLKKVYNPE
ncbi:MAG: FABP family protein [Micrococcaceae bacterium]